MVYFRYYFVIPLHSFKARSQLFMLIFSDVQIHNLHNLHFHNFHNFHIHEAPSYPPHHFIFPLPSTLSHLHQEKSQFSTWSRLYVYCRLCTDYALSFWIREMYVLEITFHDLMYFSKHWLMHPSCCGVIWSCG